MSKKIDMLDELFKAWAYSNSGGNLFDPDEQENLRKAFRAGFNFAAEGKQAEGKFLSPPDLGSILERGSQWL